MSDVGVRNRMSAISSAYPVSSVEAYQAPQNTQQAKPAKSQPIEDTVQLSKTAQAALAAGSGDADHDGDSK